MDEPPSLPPTLEPVQPVQPRAPLMSLSARIMNVFAVPGEVFDDVKASVPSISNYLVPAFLYLLVGWVGAWLIYSQPAIQQQQRELTDKMIQKMVDKGMIPKEQAEKQMNASTVGSKFTGYIAPIFAAFVGPIIWALVIWLGGRWVCKAPFEFIKALEVAGLANAIAVLGALVNTLLVVALGDMFASASPTLLMKGSDPQALSFALASLANPLTMWALAVRSIGLARLANASFTRAAVFIFGLWIFWMALMIAIGQAVKAVFS